METIVTNYIRENKVNIFVAISRYIVCNIATGVIKPHSQTNKKNFAFPSQENCRETDNKEAGSQQHT